MIDALRKLQDIRFARYLAASVGALAVDVGCFLLLLAGGMLPALASAVGYTAGIAAHWLLSSRTVFADSVAERGMKRTQQKAMFVVSALLGLGLTTAIVGVADWLAFDPRVAKLVAIAASFTLTWLLRSHIIFRAPAAGQA
ncbi:MAG: GtrA family protein [Sphingomonadaceae bacterium]|nr:GtrA family protein [Sphingomonadaceae bacterium]MCP5384814.1 GtrA family protein [Altererythrobacter sp.]MCP5390130.1 GtrA family protein [Sphingomonadaceae bacterium]MCP5392537.1 GtrA family protein [Sphingomonadaceae bacterium]